VKGGGGVRKKEHIISWSLTHSCTGNEFNNTALWILYTYITEELENGVNKGNERERRLVNETRNLLSFI